MKEFASRGMGAEIGDLRPRGLSPYCGSQARAASSSPTQSGPDHPRRGRCLRLLCQWPEAAGSGRLHRTKPTAEGYCVSEQNTVLVLGATGMLGNAVFRLFAASPGFLTWGSARGGGLVARLPATSQSQIVTGVDVENVDHLDI